MNECVYEWWLRDVMQRSHLAIVHYSVIVHETACSCIYFLQLLYNISPPIPLPPPPPHTQPVVVSYDPEEGARLAKNTAVANLPYMHRNPAV